MSESKLLRSPQATNGTMTRLGPVMLLALESVIQEHTIYVSLCITAEVINDTSYRIKVPVMLLYIHIKGQIEC